MITYPFPEYPVQRGYCVFSRVLEECSLTLFHATPFENFYLIIDEGFKSDYQLNGGDVRSVSFAKRSCSALDHGMRKRGKNQVKWCIFAVRYKTLDRAGLRINTSYIHDDTLDPPPEIIGYCIVPANYVHK